MRSRSSAALRVDGICGPETWAALVESGFRLGDRLLYLRRPMLRGDDVIELQRRLNVLGFDAGREDGIFGPATGRALTEFQRNVGLAADGIFGPDTAHELGRIGSRRPAPWPRARSRASASGRSCAAARAGSQDGGCSSRRLPVSTCSETRSGGACARPARSWSRHLRRRRLGARRGRQPLRRRPLLRDPSGA